MDYAPLHSWDVTPSEAVVLQKSLRERVQLQPLPSTVKLVAGADISFNKFSDVIYAALVVLSLPELKVVTTAGVVTRTRFPYVPGLLSFRETPPLLEAWEQLTVLPDVIMLDGQGIAHPRRFGIASHVGLLLELPTIGCAKTILVGKYGALPEEAGHSVPLLDKGETIGAALRTKDRTNPVFVSPGHLADVPTAVALTLQCVKGYHAAAEAGLLPLGGTPARSGRSKYRIPEPTRLAHLLVNAMRRGEPWTPPKV